MSVKCYTCDKEREDGYDICRECIQKYLRICTCNKPFITTKPTHYIIGKKDSTIPTIELPEPIPEFFYTPIKGNLFHIFGCRGCQHTEEISVQNNFNDALQASIVSCVYQKVEENDSTPFSNTSATHLTRILKSTYTRTALRSEK